MDGAFKRRRAREVDLRRRSSNSHSSKSSDSSSSRSTKAPPRARRRRSRSRTRSSSSMESRSRSRRKYQRRRSYSEGEDANPYSRSAGQRYRGVRTRRRSTSRSRRIQCDDSRPRHRSHQIRQESGVRPERRVYEERDRGYGNRRFQVPPVQPVLYMPMPVQRTIMVRPFISLRPYLPITGERTFRSPIRRPIIYRLHPPNQFI